MDYKLFSFELANARQDYVDLFNEEKRVATLLQNESNKENNNADFIDSLESTLKHLHKEIELTAIQIIKMLKNSDPEIDLTSRIRYLCADRNITVAELERNIGISNGSVKRWEKSSPSIGNIVKVADYFNVTLDFLVDRVTTATPDRLILNDVLKPNVRITVLPSDSPDAALNEQITLNNTTKKILLSLARQLSYNSDKDFLIDTGFSELAEYIEEED